MYSNFGASVGGFFLAIAFFVVILLVVRALVLWYFRINDLITQVKITNALLARMAGLPDPSDTNKEQDQLNPSLIDQ